MDPVIAVEDPVIDTWIESDLGDSVDDRPWFTEPFGGAPACGPDESEIQD